MPEARDSIQAGNGLRKYMQVTEAQLSPSGPRQTSLLRSVLAPPVQGDRAWPQAKLPPGWAPLHSISPVARELCCPVGWPWLDRSKFVSF